MLGTQSSSASGAGQVIAMASTARPPLPAPHPSLGHRRLRMRPHAIPRAPCALFNSACQAAGSRYRSRSAATRVGALMQQARSRRLQCVCVEGGKWRAGRRVVSQLPAPDGACTRQHNQKHGLACLLGQKALHALSPHPWRSRSASTSCSLCRLTRYLAWAASSSRRQSSFCMEGNVGGSTSREEAA